MTTPDDFPKHRPPPEDPELMKPGKGVMVVWLYVGGALVVLAILAIIALVVLGHA